MTGRPKVSIGMPVYNREPYIPAVLDSVLSQTYRDFELLISDNASTDRTEAIGREYAARDSRIRYVRNATNLGLAGNYNSVFRLAVGEYFRWVAGDDLCAPESLAACVEVLDRAPMWCAAIPRPELLMPKVSIRAHMTTIST
jgi:glycosyltransferase involved in cell wall biosynthesis